MHNGLDCQVLFSQKITVKLIKLLKQWYIIYLSFMLWYIIYLSLICNYKYVYILYKLPILQ